MTGGIAGPRFIVFEGGEGSGKSTAAAALASRLTAGGVDVVLTREPGGTPAGERTRALLHEDLAPWTEAFAFLTARAEIVERLVRPALDRGAVVICDRFALSTFAYQGYGRGLDLQQLWQANEIATGGLSPDFTVYLDIEPELGLARKLGEEEAIRTGLEDRAFHDRVRTGYHQLLSVLPEGTWARIDGSRDPAHVADMVWRACTQNVGQS